VSNEKRTAIAILGLCILRIIFLSSFIQFLGLVRQSQNCRHESTACSKLKLSLTEIAENCLNGHQSRRRRLPKSTPPLIHD
jgi:hypothetical protein